MFEFKCLKCKKIIRVFIGTAIISMVFCEACGDRYDIKLDYHNLDNDYLPRFSGSDNNPIEMSSGVSLPNESLNWYLRNNDIKK